MSISKLVDNKEVVVCAGSGGVGKTTVSASIAYQAAVQGRKVLVLTVDPAKRLATTLGLDLSGHSIVKVDTGSDAKGELHAGVIDSKVVFDNFVRRFAKDKEQIDKLFENSLYQQLSTTLSGSQEFTALEKLFESHVSNQFDLIVLDTPPTKHALDFLNAPQAISNLFQDSVTRWFMNPDVFKGEGFFGKIFSRGTRTVLKSLEILTGPDFIDNLISFFENIRSLQGQLRDRSKAAGKLLKSDKTHFILVTGFDEAKFEEAKYFREQLKDQKYQLGGVIINRAFPEWIDSEDLDYVDSFTNEETNRVKDYFISFQKYYSHRYHVYEDFKSIDIKVLKYTCQALRQKLLQHIKKGELKMYLKLRS